MITSGAFILLILTSLLGMYGDVKLDPHTFEQKTGESSSEYSLDIILIKCLQSVRLALIHFTQRRVPP